MTSQTYEDGDTVTYQYDNDGALAVVHDKATDITTKYRTGDGTVSCGEMFARFRFFDVLS